MTPPIAPFPCELCSCMSVGYGMHFLPVFPFGEVMMLIDVLNLASSRGFGPLIGCIPIMGMYLLSVARGGGDD